MVTSRTAAYVAPLAAVTAAFVALLAANGKSGTFFLVLAPCVVLATARWTLRAADLASCVLRSVAAHVSAVVAAVVLMALARSSDPGASAHGGVVLMLAYLVPIGVGFATTVGAFASVLAYATRSS